MVRSKLAAAEVIKAEGASCTELLKPSLPDLTGSVGPGGLVQIDVGNVTDNGSEGLIISLETGGEETG